MNTPTIDVVTITFNSSTYLKDCLQSVRSSRGEITNFIVVDGGSTDDTLDILSKNSDIITYIISEKDHGISDAFNKGILQCKSDFILLLNSDDQLIENGLTLIKQLLKNEDQIVCTKMLSYYKNRCIGEHSSSISEIEKFNSILHPGCIVSHHIYEKIGGYDLAFKVAMDYDFFSRCVVSKVNFRLVDLPLVAFREGGKSHQKKYLVLKESFLIRQKYFNAIFPKYELLKLFSRQVGELLDLFGKKETFKRFLGKR